MTLVSFEPSMKLKWYFLVICLSSLTILTSGKKKSSVVPYAINAIIEEHFAKQQASHPGNVDIIWIGRKTNKISRIIERLLKIKSDDTVIAIRRDVKYHSDDETLNLSESSIVLFGSKKLFKRLGTAIAWAFNKRKRFHHLVYVPGLTEDELFGALPEAFFFLIDHVTFLMYETEKSIKLVTSFMFTQKKCRELQLRTINHFDLTTSKWESSIFYPKKYENFHGCQIHVHVEWSSIGDLIKCVFEDELNASIVWRQKDILKCDSCDLNSWHRPLQPETDFIVSDPHEDYVVTFAIAPGEPYTDLERMFMMFDYETWVAIVVTLMIGFLVTMSLNFVSFKIKNFVAGRYIQSPTLNIVSIFLTGLQPKTPSRNFARFIFILFVVWSLIIRTCHQSMLFELLQADLRRPTVKTLDELFESNLTLHVYKNSMILNEYFISRMAMSSTRLV